MYSAYTCVAVSFCSSVCSLCVCVCVLPPGLRPAALPWRCWECGWWCWKHPTSPFPGGRPYDWWCRWSAAYGPERHAELQTLTSSFISSYSSSAAFFLYQAQCSIKTFGKEKKNWQEKLYACALCIQMKIGADGLWILYVQLKRRTLWDLAGFTVRDGSNKISLEAILIWGHVMCDECFGESRPRNASGGTERCRGPTVSCHRSEARFDSISAVIMFEQWSQT